METENKGPRGLKAVRNLDDLECMACPPKYRSLQTFYKYYSGQVVAPYPTLFIGGNHEATNYLWELYHGGWAAPNIYFLGYAGVVQFGGVRIGGLSGIFKSHDFKAGHFERPPLTDSTMRSAYHVRELEVHRLLRVRGGIDVFLSHDWPQGIAHYGDVNALLRKKTFLRREVEDGSLGSPANSELLRRLKPGYWFSAHLHTKFAAVYEHQPPPPPPVASQEEAPPSSFKPPKMVTKFLSLDKCLPGRGFLQVVEFPDVDGPLEFQYDPEWLAILKSTHNLTSVQRRPPPLPTETPPPSSEEIDSIRQLLDSTNSGLAIPQNFQPTAPAHSDDSNQTRGRMPQEALRNPQTEELFRLLGVEYNLDIPAQQQQPQGVGYNNPGNVVVPIEAATNPEEIDIDIDDDDVPESNPEEIELGDDDEEDVDPALAAVFGTG